MTTLLQCGGYIDSSDPDDQPVFHNYVNGLYTHDGEIGMRDVLYEPVCQAVVIRERVYTLYSPMRLLREQSEVITLGPTLSDDDAAKLESILEDIHAAVARVKETGRKTRYGTSRAIRVGERKKGRNY